eukprot:scaffold135513_cov42-Prasinocladus_malaysianus.AAC.2
MEARNASRSIANKCNFGRQLLFVFRPVRSTAWAALKELIGMLNSFNALMILPTVLGIAHRLIRASGAILHMTADHMASSPNR